MARKPRAERQRKRERQRNGIFLYAPRDALGLNRKKGVPALSGIPVGERHVEKLPRNAPCPCGSEKKFKYCHGASGWRGALWRLREHVRGFDGST